MIKINDDCHIVTNDDFLAITFQGVAENLFATKLIKKITIEAGSKEMAQNPPHEWTSVVITVFMEMGYREFSRDIEFNSAPSLILAIQELNYQFIESLPDYQGYESPDQ